jgi:hypothetical protein
MENSVNMSFFMSPEFYYLQMLKFGYYKSGRIIMTSQSVSSCFPAVNPLLE